MTSRFTNITSFVQTAKYSVINAQWNNFEIKNQEDVKSVDLVPATYTNKVWIKNEELIFIDIYSRRTQWLFEINGEFSSDLTVTKFFNNLLDNIESFNTRNTLYLCTASYNTDTAYTRPTDMIFIQLFQQGIIHYNHITKKYLIKLKLRAEFATA